RRAPEGNPGAGPSHDQRAAEPAPALRAASPPRRAFGSLTQHIDSLRGDQFLRYAYGAGLVDLDGDVLDRLRHVAALGRREVAERHRARTSRIANNGDEEFQATSGKTP